MKTKLLIAAMISVLISFSANAKIWRVNNNPGVNADFSTAQAAHDSVSVGDTLFFEGSPSSYGNLIMIKKLVIIGPGYGLEYNENTQANKSSAKIPYLEINDGAQHSIIMGMDFWAHGNYQHDVKISTDSVTIKRCMINQIQLVSKSKSSAIGVVISQNILVHGGISYNIYTSKTQTKRIIITNNIINGYISLKDFGQVITGNYIKGDINVHGSTITNNIIKGKIRPNQENSVSYNKTDIGDDIISFFVKNIEDPDNYYKDASYILSENSTAKGAGAFGIDCGPFGGKNTYVLSGIPKGPHIYDSTVESSTTKEDGLKISIKIKTQP